MYKLEELLTGKHDETKERFKCLETVLEQANQSAMEDINKIDEATYYEGDWF